MGRKSPLHSITLSQACDGMILAKQAADRSPNTINNYQHAFAKLRLLHWVWPLGVRCKVHSRICASFSGDKGGFPPGRGASRSKASSPPWRKRCNHKSTVGRLVCNVWLMATLFRPPA